MTLEKMVEDILAKVSTPFVIDPAPIATAVAEAVTAAMTTALQPIADKLDAIAIGIADIQSEVDVPPAPPAP